MDTYMHTHIYIQTHDIYSYRLSVQGRKWTDLHRQMRITFEVILNHFWPTDSQYFLLLRITFG